jgi:hypothetical protein
VAGGYCVRHSCRFLVAGGVSYGVNQTLLFALYEGGMYRITEASTAREDFAPGATARACVKDNSRGR